MRVDLVNHMGDDLMVVNAARVSFDKESFWSEESEENWLECDGELELKEGDKKLIGYLAKNGHWTPFSHPQITLRITAPIFVARQLFKHKVGFTENEVSRRYVDDTPEFYTPDTWRGRPTNGAKQGSSEDTVTTFKLPHYGDEEFSIDMQVGILYEDIMLMYTRMIEAGVAPEQARMILPQSMYTSWYWTASLASYARMCKLRLDAHAQAETREIAQQISDIIAPLFPVSWSTLIDSTT